MEGRDQVRTDRRPGLLGRLRQTPAAPARPSVDDLLRAMRARDQKEIGRAHV